MAVDVNARHEESLRTLDRMALWVTRHVGTFGFFLLIFGWSAVWLLWNLLAPAPLRFDPPTGFVTWLFISNLIQILLMPLIMVGQNLQARHDELRAEAQFLTTQLIEREVADIQDHLHRMEATLERLARRPGAP